MEASASLAAATFLGGVVLVPTFMSVAAVFFPRRVFSLERGVILFSGIYNQIDPDDVVRMTTHSWNGAKWHVDSNSWWTQAG